MDEPKFKVGDFAIVINDLSYMKKGDLVTIQDISNDETNKKYFVKHKSISFTVNENCLKKVHVKEVKRIAKPGEYVKVVSIYPDSSIPLNKFNKPMYKIGDILKIIENESIDCDDEVRYEHESDSEGMSYILFPDEYVVLEINDYLTKEETKTPVDTISDDELVLTITSNKIEVFNEEKFIHITYVKDMNQSLLENISDALEKYSKEFDAYNFSAGDIVEVTDVVGIIDDAPEIIEAENLTDKQYLLSHYSYGFSPSTLQQVSGEYKVIYISICDENEEDIAIIENMNNHAILLVWKCCLRKVVD